MSATKFHIHTKQRAKLFEHKMWVMISSTIIHLSQKFLILRRIERSVITHVHRSSCERNLNFLYRYSKNHQISNFITIRPAFSDFAHARSKSLAGSWRKWRGNKMAQLWQHKAILPAVFVSHRRAAWHLAQLQVAEHGKCLVQRTGSTYLLWFPF